MNVEATIGAGPYAPAIGRIVRDQRARVAAGLETATFSFRSGPDPIATLDYAAASLLELDRDSTDVAVFNGASNISVRAPTGERLLKPECRAADFYLRGSRLCQLALGEVAD